jgi:hypothetical protein
MYIAWSLSGIARSSRRAIAGLAVGAAVIAAGSAAGPAALASPRASSGAGSLRAVDAVSASNMWAVGSAYTGSTSGSLIEHYAGHGWQIVPSPNPAGATSVYLQSVDAVSASNVWAVGYSSVGAASRTLIEHWNGTAWKIVGSPNASGTGGSYLYAVRALSASNVWAVGYDQPSFTTLVEHWNGLKWQIVASPNPGGSQGSWLYGIDASAAGKIWAVGYWTEGQTTSTLVEQWNGSSWAIVPSPSPGGSGAVSALQAVRSVSASNAWAVGYLYNGSSTTTVSEHWNGTQWQVVASPNPTGAAATSLVAVDAPSATDMWAVGDSTNGSSVTSTVIEGWSGAGWKVVPSPNPAGSADAQLTGVAALSITDAWAVGFSWNGSVTTTVVEHWNGQAWKLVTSPS